MGRNTCAQRLAARILNVPAAELERTHPPDTPLRLLGTSAAQLARMLTAYGRPSAVRHGSGPHAGDAVCVDLRHLRGGVPRLHWMLVDDARPDAVRLDGRWYPRDAFDRAWACRASPFPMHRRAKVVSLGTREEKRGKPISPGPRDGHS